MPERLIRSDVTDADLQLAMDTVDDGTTLIVEGDRTATIFTVTRSNLTIKSDPKAVFDRFRLFGEPGNIVLHGLKFERNTPPDSNSYFAVHLQSVKKLQIVDCEFTGHGYIYGVRGSNNSEADGILIKNCHFHELENIPIYLMANNIEIVGNHAHDCYKTADPTGFVDVDMINAVGENILIEGNIHHGFSPIDSRSKHFAGKGGGAVSAHTYMGPPHCDFFQTFTVWKDIAQTIPWPTNNLTIRKNLVYELWGNSVILESDRLGDLGPPNITNVVIEDNDFYTYGDYQSINLRGVQGLKIRNNRFGMASHPPVPGEADINGNFFRTSTIQGGRFVWIQHGSDKNDQFNNLVAGSHVNDDIEIYKNHFFGGTTAAIIEGQDDFGATNWRMWDNIRINGDIDRAIAGVYLDGIDRSTNYGTWPLLGGDRGSC